MVDVVLAENTYMMEKVCKNNDIIGFHGGVNKYARNSASVLQKCSIF